MAEDKVKKYKQHTPEAIRIGELIRAYRTEQNLTQEDLAGMAEVNVNTIRNIENGKKAMFESISILGRVLKIPAEELLYGNSEQEHTLPSEFYQLDNEDQKFVFRSLKTTIIGCLSDLKYRLQA